MINDDEWAKQKVSSALTTHTQEAVMKRQRFPTGTIGVMVLSVGLVLANYGGGVTPTAAAPADAHAGLPQNWDQKIPVATRFVVLADFDGVAVRDNETGLVWERPPLPTFHPWDSSAGFLVSALAQCTSRTTGGRKGWRLPSVHELASLVDPANAVPSLPTGHPFTNVQSAFYWSATTLADDPSLAWVVSFNDGLVSFGNKTLATPAWCVRGGMNADAY
jgi:hypothetical protein